MVRIQILGTGCPKCMKLLENARAAADQLGVECEIEKVTDLSEIMRFGVMLTPALVIDGQVISSGKVLTGEQIRSALQAHQ